MIYEKSDKSESLLNPEDELRSTSSLSVVSQPDDINRLSTSTAGFSPRTDSATSWRTETSSTTVTGDPNSRHQSYLSGMGGESHQLQELNSSNWAVLRGTSGVPKSPDVKGKGRERESQYSASLAPVPQLVQIKKNNYDLCADPGQSTPTSESSDQVWPSSPPVLSAATNTKPRSLTNSSGNSSEEIPLPALKDPSSNESSEQGTNSRETSSHTDGTVIHHQISPYASTVFSGSRQGSNASSAAASRLQNRYFSPSSQTNVVILGRTSEPGSSVPSTSDRHSILTSSDHTNYEILNRSSSGATRHGLAPSSNVSSNPNYRVLGRTSEPGSSGPSLNDHRNFTASTNNPNYETYGQTSPVDSITTSQAHSLANYDYSPTQSDLAIPAQTRSAYSRESLVIPPLQPTRQRSSEGLGYYKQHSRESLRSVSMTSLTSSFANDFDKTVGGGKPLTRIPSLKDIPETGSSWLGSLGFTSAKGHKPTQTWDGRLSPVPSMAEETASGRTSRQLEGHRKGNTMYSLRTQSRQMSSPVVLEGSLRDDSSSLQYPEPSYGLDRRETRDFTSNTADFSESTARSMTTDLVENPKPTFRRPSYHDELHDTLTEIPILHDKPSRRHLSSQYPHGDSRSNSLTSGTSRSNSFLGSALPSWAMVYYGSGERKFFGAPLSVSGDGQSSRNNSMKSGSPSLSQFPQNVYSARRRPKEADRQFSNFTQHTRHQSNVSRVSRWSSLSRFSTRSRSVDYSYPRDSYSRDSTQSSHIRQPSEAPSIIVTSGNHTIDITPVDSMQIEEAPDVEETRSQMHGRVMHSFKHRSRKPPSTWSPHLQLDKRVDPRSTRWDASSVEWSQGGLSSRRNRQIILFICGFVMPISWFVASFLPLPERVEIPPMTEQDLTVKSRREMLMEMNRFWTPIDERRLQSARWWRIMNRIFSVVGVVVLVLIVSYIMPSFGS